MDVMGSHANHLNIIGIDLSGPGNAADTALVWFQETPFGLLWMNGWAKDADGNRCDDADLNDKTVLQIIDSITTMDRGADHSTVPGSSDFQTMNEPVQLMIGIDSPLSYQDGGGDRPGDKRLRTFIKEQGLHHGSIMSPTFQRMVYLTLRGIQLTRALQHRVDTLPRYQSVRMCEVHPGGALLLRQPWEDRATLREYKKNTDAYLALASRLPAIGFHGIPDGWLNGSTHRLDAIGAALAAWHYARSRSMWLEPANADAGHPFDYVI